MKTFVPIRKSSLKFMLLVSMMASTMVSQAQELVFKNSSHEPGSPAAGSDGCIYRFPSVMNNVDALVKINARSSALVTLINIDVTSSGYDKAFQPQIAYNNGNVTGATNWWMEFGITFVNKNTTTPIAISTFNATAVDLDGDNNNLHEYASFYYPNSFTLENPTNLSISNLTQLLSGILTNVGKTFDGSTTDHSGIDTLATNLMVTTRYNNVSSITYRAGGATTGSSSGASRQYSVYFKSFNYNSPIITLPVKLESFTAILDGSKTDLRWTTSQEINVSHFEIERSVNGTGYKQISMVFAAGNSDNKINYNYNDDITDISNGVINYRLKMVDIDDKYSYSDVRMIRIGKQNEKSITVNTYPNPVSSELRVTIPNTWQGKKVNYEIFSNNGQAVIKTKAASASQTETINFSKFPPGFYIVKVSCNGELAQQKIIKQ